MSASLTQLISSSASWWLLAHEAVSSTYHRLDNSHLPTDTPRCPTSASHITISVYMLKRFGDNMHPCLTLFPMLNGSVCKWFCVPIVPLYSCFLFDIEVLYQVDQVCRETHLYHDIEQLVVACIVKGHAVIDKSDVGSFFGLKQFLYHDLECTDQVCSSSAFSETSLFCKLLRDFLL